MALKAKGMKFVLLRDVETSMTLNPVPAHNLQAGVPGVKKSTPPK